MNDGLEKRRRRRAAPARTFQLSHGLQVAERAREFPPMPSVSSSRSSKTPADLRAHAAEFRRLAETTADPAIREQLARLAEMYIELAEQKGRTPAN